MRLEQRGFGRSALHVEDIWSIRMLFELEIRVKI